MLLEVHAIIIASSSHSYLASVMEFFFNDLVIYVICEMMAKTAREQFWPNMTGAMLTINISLENFVLHFPSNELLEHIYAKRATNKYF